MRKAIRCAIVFGIFSLCPMLLSAQGAQANRTECAAVEEALRASLALKPGMTRAEVERAFATDGGMNFREKSFYVFKKCRYLKIDVEFTADPKVERAFAPTDTIKSVSKLYVDYPHAD
jgi:hypothetical protein